MPKKVYDQIHPRQVGTLGPGKHADGRGLYLYVTGPDARSWIWRGMVQGRRREIAIGPADRVPLKQARDMAIDWARIAHAGNDPRKVRDEARRRAITFEAATRRVWAEQIEAQHGGRYPHSWLASMEQYAWPMIGHLPVNTITQGDVLRVLGPIWTERHPTARLIRQRIRTVMDWARAAGLFEGVNPVEGVERGLARVKAKAEHRAAVPWQDVPGVFRRLGEIEGVAPLALQMIILTGSRVREVTNATWAEIDLDAALWTVPAHRMKAGKEHRVPLNPEASAILGRVRRLSRGLVFPGRVHGKPVAGSTIVRLLRDMDVTATVHGFRSSFVDWAEERGGVRREVAEMCLAHVVGSATERAYRRTDVLEERREALARWGRFVSPASADVVAIR